MDELFTMAGVHPRDRLAYWCAAARKLFGDHEFRVGARFDATVYGASLGHVDFALADWTGIHGAVRMARDVARGESEGYLLCLQLAGSAIAAQDGREAAIHPGDFVLVDVQRPYACRYSAHSRKIVFKIPRHALQARLGAGSEITARAVRKSDGVGGMASAFLAMIPDRACALQPAVRGQIAEQALDLASLALSTETAGRKPRLSSTSAVSLLSLRSAIELRLTDPGLDATTAAAAAGVSVRYANVLLSQHDTSIARLIQARRLEHCRRALADHAQSRRTIAEIAYAWGFSDPSHFGRRFKLAFGCSPSEYREHMKG
jgi:AraC family transcriptional activator of tynA and feaB